MKVILSTFLFISISAFAQSAKSRNQMIGIEAVAKKRDLKVVRLSDREKESFETGFDLGANIFYRHMLTNRFYLFVKGGIWMPELIDSGSSVLFDDMLIDAELGLWMKTGIKSELSISFRDFEDIHPVETAGVYSFEKEKLGSARLQLTQYFAGRADMGFGVNLGTDFLVIKGDAITSRTAYDLSLFVGSYKKESSLFLDIGGASLSKKISGTHETQEIEMFAKIRYGFGF